MTGLRGTQFFYAGQHSFAILSTKKNNLHGREGWVLESKCGRGHGGRRTPKRGIASEGALKGVFSCIGRARRGAERNARVGELSRGLPMRFPQVGQREKKKLSMRSSQPPLDFMWRKARAILEAKPWLGGGGRLRGRHRRVP